MTDPASPLQFSASFPCHGRFRPAVGELAVKVATSLGYSDDEAREVGLAVERAFAEAAEGDCAHHEVEVRVTLRSGGEATAATVSCASRTLLELSRPHSH
jgi:hypothetical protein